MGKLNGARVALLEARMSSELADLVRRHGGEVIAAPALRETEIDATGAVSDLIKRLAQDSIQVVIFQTGVGVKALFAAADRIGCLPQLLSELSAVTTVARGPKPTAVLRQYRVPISISVREPYSTAEIIESLNGLELEEKGVALLHYGERNAELAEAILSRRARLEELYLYEWQMPVDTAPLQSLIDEIVAGTVDAVAFTSQIQVRHLFNLAKTSGKAEDLKNALNNRTVVAAIGPTCAAAIRSVGVTPHVVPQPPKMGPMVLALVEYLEHR